MNTDRAYELGFRTVKREHADRSLQVEGTVPEWIDGALIRNGPGKFEFGDERATHWFDGLAMLRRYGFTDGQVTYTNRFLRTDAYAAADEGYGAGEFASGGGSVRQALRWLRSLGPPRPTDNANVHVVRVGDHHVAVTEAPRRVAFDPDTLETRGEFRWRDDFPEHLTTAHFSVDPVRNETIGYSTTFGRNPKYHLYRIPGDRPARERIASVPAEGPGYVHDCSLTESYVVLVETPLKIAVLRALLPWSEGLLDMLRYDEEHDARFIVVDRDTGDIVAEPRTSAFFTFHHVNAYEPKTDNPDEPEAADANEPKAADANEPKTANPDEPEAADDGVADLVVDLVTFPDDDIVDSLSFDALSDRAFAGAPNGRLDTFRIDLESDVVDRSRPYDGGLELPTVPRTLRGRPYRYAYAQATDREGANGLVKVDRTAGTAREWWERGVYVEEPRMIQRPDGTAEDDGVVLAPALDVDAGRSMLLVFDAETLVELARARLPHAVPFGFHGRFFPNG